MTRLRIAHPTQCASLNGMKPIRYFLALILIASTCTLAQAEPTDSAKKPSWFERIFGSSKTSTEEATESESSTKKAAKAKPETKAAKTQKEAPSKGFTKEEREALESWQKGKASWKKKGKPLPPGLQKKVDRGGELPPGWQKKLEVGSTLDKELNEQARSLPEEILKRLPEAPENTEIVQIGEEIVRVIENTREIVDILGDFGGTAKKD